MAFKRINLNTESLKVQRKATAEEIEAEICELERKQKETKMAFKAKGN